MGRRAPILGITGLVFIAFALISYWWLRGPTQGVFALGWYALAHLVAGIGCLVAYFSGGTASAADFVGRRSTRYGTNAFVYTAFFVAVLVMANFLGARYHYRVDLSTAGVNSLSEQSREVVDSLESDVQVDAFLEGGRDPVLEELFEAYAYATDRIKVRFIDPQVNPELAQKALISHVPSLKISTGERSTVVTRTDEESVTNGIFRISSAAQAKVYFVEGHGEAAIDDRDSPGGMALFADALRNQNYVVDRLFLPDVESVPEDASTVVASSGERRWFPHEIAALERYLVAGGSVLFLLEPRKDGEVAEMLARWGVEVGDDVIVDQQVRLFQGLTLGLDPVVSDYGRHPAVAPLKERTSFSLARSVRPAPDPAGPLVVTSLAMTAPTSWAETDLERLFGASEAKLTDDDLAGPVPIAVAVSAYVRDLPDADADAEGELLMAVFGDSSFATNKYWRQLFNDALALSTVAWLTGEEQFISIGPRAIRASRAHLSRAQARTVFYLSLLVIPELILLTGIAVWWRRSSS